MKSLTKPELDSLLAVALKHDVRDWLMLLVTFNHGLRVSETLSLSRINLTGNRLTVARLKGSRKTTQPLLPEEEAGLKKLALTPGLFFLPQYTNRGSARTIFWRKMQAYGLEAGISQHKLHPHALKHTTGRLGYEGGMGIPELQMWLGHANGKNTMVYLESTEEQAAAAFAAAAGR